MKNFIIGLGGFGTNFIDEYKDLSKEEDGTLAIACKNTDQNCHIRDKIDLDTNYFEEQIPYLKKAKSVTIINGLGGNSCKILMEFISYIQTFNSKIEVIINKPFKWEGDQRTDLANKIIKELESKNIKHKMFDNNDLLKIINDDVSTEEAFDIHNKSIYEYIAHK